MENPGSSRIIILCTTPDQKTAHKIARDLVENKLAACCNILDNVKSVYRWQGKVQAEKECLMIIKSVSQNFEKIENRIRKMHPYEVPEIIASEITSGSADYLKWITENSRV